MREVGCHIFCPPTRICPAGFACKLLSRRPNCLRMIACHPQTLWLWEIWGGVLRQRAAKLLAAPLGSHSARPCPRPHTLSALGGRGGRCMEVIAKALQLLNETGTAVDCRQLHAFTNSPVFEFNVSIGGTSCGRRLHIRTACISMRVAWTSSEVATTANA